MAQSMRKTSRIHVQNEIEQSADHAEFYAQRVNELLTTIAETCATTASAGGLAGVRDVVLMIHEWADALDTNCPRCRLPELAREVVASSDDDWGTAEVHSFANRYMLNLCGFVDGDDMWHIDNSTLAHIVSRINKAELITHQTVELLSRDSGKAREDLQAARELAQVAKDMSAPRPVLSSALRNLGAEDESSRKAEPAEDVAAEVDSLSAVVFASN